MFVTCSVISFVIMGLYLQWMNIMAIEIWHVTKNTFGKYVYDFGIFFPHFVFVILGFS